MSLGIYSQVRWDYGRAVVQEVDTGMERDDSDITVHLKLSGEATTGSGD